MSADSVVTAQSEDVSGTTLDGVYVSDLDRARSAMRAAASVIRGAFNAAAG